MTDYELVTSFDVLGYYGAVGEVIDAVPLVMLDGGPRDGWVYDERRLHPRPAGPVDPNMTEFQYEYAIEVGRLSDGRFVRIYRPAADAEGHTEAVRR